MPDDLDVRRLIEEVKARPIIWDVRYGEYKDRTNTPQKWAEIAAVMGVDVEHCKRKWKNLRDAYRAEVRRAERRVERLKAAGNHDGAMDVRSKWTYFEPMSFINDSRRPRYNSHTHKSEGEGSNGSHEDNAAFHSTYDIKMEPHHTTDEDDFDDDDQLLEEFVSAATPQAVRRLSNSISVANAVEDEAAADASGRQCKCPNRADDQVHFLENLEREEQSLMQSTRMDMTRDNSTSHVGDSDYNFLVSFLPQMKRMSELQNLQFRAKMSELVLNIMSPAVKPARNGQQIQQSLVQQQHSSVTPYKQTSPEQILLQLQNEQMQLQQPAEELQHKPFTSADFMDADTLENSNLSINSDIVGEGSNNWT